MILKQGNCLLLLKELQDRSVDCVITDPPYGINYQSGRLAKKDRFDVITGDGEVNTNSLSQIYRVLKDGGALYLFTCWDVCHQWAEDIKKAGFLVKNWIVWDRMVHGLGDLKGSYAPQYDLIIFATKGRHLLKNGRPQDIIRVRRIEPEKLNHPTEKPIPLIRQLLINSTEEGDVVLDPFAGSGSVGVACKQLKRDFIGFEIDEVFFKLAGKRLIESENQAKL